MHDVDESMNSFEFVQAKMSPADTAQNSDLHNRNKISLRMIPRVKSPGAMNSGDREPDWLLRPICAPLRLTIPGGQRKIARCIYEGRKI